MKNADTCNGRAKARSEPRSCYGLGKTLPTLFTFCAILIASLSCLAQGQSDTPPPSLVPPPDPGYSLYYHDPVGSPDLAARWGYHDGWTEGRHDRNHGDVFDAQDKEHYVMPPEHGGHPGITRNQYVTNYRLAYSRGYKHGSRI